MKPEILTSTVTTRRFTIKLTSDMILKMLHREVTSIPLNANVSFNVPIGGNYSGTSIEISNDDPLYVTWEKVHVEDTRS